MDVDLNFDIDAFYREQDKRMNLLDDDLNDYVARMGTRTRQDADCLTPQAEHADPLEHTIQIPQNRRPSQPANTPVNLNSNAEILLSVNNEHHEVVSKVALQSPLHHSGSSMDSSANLDVKQPVQALNFDAQPSVCSRTLQAVSARPVTPISALSEAHKRKPPPDDLEASPKRKKQRVSRSLPETPSPLTEEITSFTVSPSSKKRSITLLADDPLRQVAQPSSKKRKIPALKLTTLAPPVSTKDVTHDAHLLSSPIEDSDGLLPKSVAVPPTSDGKSALQAGSSRLYLEVIERVAQHSSTKRRDKVIKLLNTKAVPKTAVHDNEPSIIDISSSPPPPDRAVIQSSSTKREILQDAKSKTKPIKGKKVKPPAITPLEYALKLRGKATLATRGAPKKSVNRFLEGMRIFYIGGDMQFASEQTRGRMNLIVKYGGDLLPAYDASLVTHIITDTSMISTLKALGLKRLSEIPPHVPTVTWKWIAAGIGRANKVGWMDEVFWHAAFPERIDAGIDHSRSRWKGKEKASDNTEFSRISEFTQDKLRQQTPMYSTHSLEDDDEKNDPTGRSSPSPSAPELCHKKSTFFNTSIVNNSKIKEEDPLAEFYAQAKAEHEIGWLPNGDGHDSELTPSDVEIEEPVKKTVAKRGWTCDNKETQRQTCINQDIIDKLQELKELHQSKPGDDDHWRVFSYNKCIRALRNYPKRIESFAEARAIRGVGEKTAAKIMEILETGALRRIGYERTEDVAVTRLFLGIYGVGQSTAFKWYSAGCRTLDDLIAGKGGVKLNPAQEIGIRFYDDINERMPRQEAKAIFDLIKPIALKIDPKLFIDIMGSYRRGKKDCGDIDILITRPIDDGRTHKRVLSRLLQELHALHILMEDLAVPEDPDDLKAIYRGLCHIPKDGLKRRRIDFLTVPWKSRGAALLYYTGDDIFNRAIRLKANSLGYSLNQRGLFGGVVRDPKDRRVKLDQGSLVASETEEEIFKILNVPWQEPHERVRG